LVNKIGTGGMAELYMARQSGLKGFEKVLAIKRILPHLTQDNEFVTMFIDEAKLAALLSHQNIVLIFDLGHVDTMYYIAMEYVMGKDLRTVLHQAKAKGQPLSISHALLIATKVCSGLDYAHRKKDLSGQDLNLVHRDISPQNILVSYEGEVKLVDFGIAKAASQSTHTQAGIIKGKLLYMSPEQAWGKPVDRRSDIFALGAVLYEMLTGHKLFKGDSEFHTLEKVREARVEPPPTKLNADIPPELEAVLLKALAKEPQNRYQSALEFETALEDLISSKGYDFSSIRLAQYLQTLFSDEMARDSERFRLALQVAVETEDQSTKIKARTSASSESPPRAVQPATPPAGVSSGPRRHPTERTPTTDRLQVPRADRTPTGTRRIRRTHPVLTGFFMVLTVLALGWAAIATVLVNHPPLREAVSRQVPMVDSMVEFTSLGVDRVLSQMYGLWDRIQGTPSAPVEAVVAPAVAEEQPAPGLQVIDPFPPKPQTEPVLKPASPELSVRPPAPKPVPRPEMRAEIDRLFEEAKAAYHEKRLTEVETKLRRIIDLNPRMPMAHHLLGTVHKEQKDLEGAMTIFLEATKLFPDHAVLHYDLGLLYADMGVVSLAQEALSRALELDPNAPQANLARGRLRDLSEAPKEPPAAALAPTEPPLDTPPPETP
jgi:serine/threonine protein kinase